MAALMGEASNQQYDKSCAPEDFQISFEPWPSQACLVYDNDAYKKDKEAAAD
jgi:hypothetical protein